VRTTQHFGTSLKSVLVCQCQQEGDQVLHLIVGQQGCEVVFAPNYQYCTTFFVQVQQLFIFTQSNEKMPNKRWESFLKVF
jgi:hypothetical protein